MKLLKVGFLTGLVALLVITCNGCSKQPKQNQVETPLNTEVPSLSQTIPTETKVQNPLNVSQYLQEPCAVLTTGQVTEFLGAEVAGKPALSADIKVRPSCSWARLDGSQASILITLPNGPMRGLNEIYQGSSGFILTLEPIHGYPIVAYGITDDRPRGECHVAVAVDDLSFIEVSNGLSKNSIGSKNPCAVSREIAGTIILNIQGKN